MECINKDDIIEIRHNLDVMDSNGTIVQLKKFGV